MLNFLPFNILNSLVLHIMAVHSYCTPHSYIYPCNIGSVSDTSVMEIEESFRSFIKRIDIAIILINQNVSMLIQVNFSINFLPQFNSLFKTSITLRLRRKMVETCKYMQFQTMSAFLFRWYNITNFVLMSCKIQSYSAGS